MLKGTTPNVHNCQAILILASFQVLLGPLKHLPRKISSLLSLKPSGFTMIYTISTIWLYPSKSVPFKTLLHDINLNHLYVLCISVSFAKRQLQPSPRTTAFRQAPLHRTSSARHGAARRRWRVPGPLDSWGHTDQKNICQEPFFWGSIMFYDVPCYVSSL